MEIENLKNRRNLVLAEEFFSGYNFFKNQGRFIKDDNV